MPRRIDTISGKVKVRSFDRLDSDRYQYLELSQAEPNLGSPDSDNALVSLLKDGTRLLTTQPILSGLTLKLVIRFVSRSLSSIVKNRSIHWWE